MRIKWEIWKLRWENIFRIWKFITVVIKCSYHILKWNLNMKLFKRGNHNVTSWISIYYFSRISAELKSKCTLNLIYNFQHALSLCINKIKQNFVRKFEASFSYPRIFFAPTWSFSSRCTYFYANLILAHEAVIIPFSINNLKSCNLKCNKWCPHYR